MILINRNLVKLNKNNKKLMLKLFKNKKMKPIKMLKINNKIKIKKLMNRNKITKNLKKMLFKKEFLKLKLLQN